MAIDDEKERLQRSWVANASAWTGVVREGGIESRRVATDAAIVEVVTGLRPGRVLDLGCGEGWLARALAAKGMDVCGVDASRPLVEAATELGGGTFLTASYEELASGQIELPEDFDVAVANFAILEEDLTAIFAAVSRWLRQDGALVIQTVHPAFAGEGAYVSGWRTETFAAFPGEWPEAMPWYFRTLSAWVALLTEYGWRLAELREPVHPGTSRALSIIFVCRRLGQMGFP